MTTRKKDYEVYDPVALDDVTLAADFPDGKERLKSPSFWEKLSYGVEAAGLVYQGTGPSEWLSQTLAGSTDQDLPIVLKMTLAGDANAMVLVYLYENNVEIHLPESYLLTGYVEEDESRSVEFWGVAKWVGQAVGVAWSYIEWAGQEESTCLDQSVIARHRASLYERAECDPKIDCRS